MQMHLNRYQRRNANAFSTVVARLTCGGRYRRRTWFLTATLPSATIGEAQGASAPDRQTRESPLFENGTIIRTQSRERSREVSRRGPVVNWIEKNKTRRCDCLLRYPAASSIRVHLVSKACAIASCGSSLLRGFRVGFTVVVVLFGRHSTLSSELARTRGIRLSN